MVLEANLEETKSPEFPGDDIQQLEEAERALKEFTEENDRLEEWLWEQAWETTDNRKLAVTLSRGFGKRAQLSYSIRECECKIARLKQRMTFDK